MDIQLSSADRSSGSAENFVKFIDWSQHVGTGAPAEGYEISLSSASIPYTFYGITEGHNRVTWIANALEYEIEIPPAMYQPGELAVVLQTLMSAELEAQNYEVVYLPAQGKFQFTKVAGANTWRFTSTGDGQTFDAFGPIGFTPDQLPSAQTDNNVAFVAPCVTELVHTTRIYIHVGWPGVRNYDSRVNQWNNVMGVLTPYGNWGFILDYQPPNPTRFKSYSLPEQVVVFLTDHKGEILDLNCGEWFLTLTVYGLSGITLSSEEVRIAEPNRARVAAARTITAVSHTNQGRFNAPARGIDSGFAASGQKDNSHMILNQRR